MTPSVLLVLAFLDLFPLPVCTLAFPQGDVMAELTCPNDHRDYVAMDGALFPCIRRLKI